MTSSHPQLVQVLCDVTAEHSRSVNLGTRYVYTCVGAECGRGRGGKTEQKRHIHGNDVIPLREV